MDHRLLGPRRESGVPKLARRRRKRGRDNRVTGGQDENVIGPVWGCRRRLAGIGDWVLVAEADS